jgi:hypothetical protein
MQLSLFEVTTLKDERIKECLGWLKRRKFDIRRQPYESHENYNRRILISTYAFRVDYQSPKWNSLENWAEICPSGTNNRLPRDKRELPPHDCFFLKLRHIAPSDWLVPAILPPTPSQMLPRRATYKPIEGDILLSRFKEPLGKCVLYQRQPSPLYVSNNYFLLRPKPHVSPALLLALLKSPFLRVQLHHLIRPRSVITEMFIGETTRIRLPNLTPELREQITSYAIERIHAESEYKSLSCKSKTIQQMNEMEFAIAASVLKFATE